MGFRTFQKLHGWLDIGSNGLTDIVGLKKSVGILVKEQSDKTMIECGQRNSRDNLILKGQKSSELDCIRSSFKRENKGLYVLYSSSKCADTLVLEAPAP